MAGMALAGIGTAIAVIESIKEQLEYHATNHILLNYEDFDAVRIKVLDFSGKKITDIGAMNSITFSVTVLESDPQNCKYNEAEKFVLMALLSPGWINEYGVDYTEIKWDMWNQKKWNDLMFKFFDMNSPVDISIYSDSLLIPYYKKINSRYYDTTSTKQVVFTVDGYTNYYEHTDEYFSINQAKLEANGVKVKKGNSTISLIPWYQIKRDDYIISDFSEDLKFFSNEKSIGLFYRSIGRSITIKRTLVREIHRHFNDMSED